MSPRPPFPPTPAKPSKHRLFIGVLLGVVLLGGIVSFLLSGGKSTRKAPPRQEIVTITLPPPPPPPPPPKIEPPKVEPPPDEKKEEIVEEKPVDLTPPDEPIEAPPSEDLGTNITGGNGPDMGLTRGGGNGRIGGGKTGGGGKNKYARYSISAKNSIEQALRNDPTTRKAIINGLTCEFWPDSGGTITRARLIGTSADPTLDLAVKRVLIGLQTPPAATPAEMPPSVKIRISARKSSL
jgi:periplasmic protein TonB